MGSGYKYIFSLIHKFSMGYDCFQICCLYENSVITHVNSRRYVVIRFGISTPVNTYYLTFHVLTLFYDTNVLGTLLVFIHTDKFAAKITWRSLVQDLSWIYS